MSVGTRPLRAAALLLVVTGHAAAEPESCHLHAPTDYPTFSKQPLVIPAVGDLPACERFNRERFGSMGRCHCVSDLLDNNRVWPYPAPADPDPEAPLL
ncbi:MAG: hypothetical protein ABW153_19325 [Sedimenticola sp.]